MPYSVRGVARRYLGMTTGVGISVIDDIFQNPIVGTFSLASKLRILARKNFSFAYNECIYSGTASYEQTWTQVTIRIQLVPDSNVSQATLDALMQVWATTIANAWSNKFGLGLPGEITSPLIFEAVFTNTNTHHAIRVSNGPGTSRADQWFTNIGSCVAHEYGHLFGLSDEYTDPQCPNRNPVNTGTIMDNRCSLMIVSRFMTVFSRAVGSNIVPL